MIPRAEVFFAEVRVAFAEIAERLGLEGPTERRDHLPMADSTYRCGRVQYEVDLATWEGYLHIRVGLETESVLLTVDVEPLAIAAGLVEKRGGVSFSARSPKQMKNSLAGQLRYVEPLHPLLSTDPESAAALMRKAGAREWGRGGTQNAEGPASGGVPDAGPNSP